MEVFVNCRIGSLENIKITLTTDLHVNCRIGSLERISPADAVTHCVNCRIGSLEKEKTKPNTHAAC